MGRQFRKSFRKALVAVIGVLIILLVSLLTDYEASQVTRFGVLILVLCSLTLLTGYGGIVSLGHGAFMALGGYALLICHVHYGVPLLPSVALAVVFTAIVSWICGLSSLRLSGPYLALVTFSLALAVPEALKSDALAPLTGGVRGLMLNIHDIETRWEFAGFTFLGRDQLLALVVILSAAAVIVGLVRFRVSPFGRALIALRDNDTAAIAYGISDRTYKLTLFTVSGTLAGVAGVLSALGTGYIAPDSYPFMFSLILLVGIIVGGVTSPLGAILGALFVFYVPDLASHVSVAAPTLIYGLLLLITLLVFPLGLAAPILGRYRKVTTLVACEGKALSNEGDRHETT